MQQIPKEAIIELQSDIMPFAELLLHWHCEAPIKIAYQVLSGNLNIYLVHSYITDADKNNKAILTKPSALNMGHLTYSNQFYKIVFLRHEIDKIETENAHYLFSYAEPMYFSELGNCTSNNINKVAPQALYLICSFLYTETKPNYILLRHALVKTDICFPDQCLPGPRDEWVIPDGKLWPKNYFVETAVQKSASFDLGRIHEFVTHKQSLGMLDPARLAKLVDITFPGLKPHELGELLPHKPGREISFDGMRKRGYDLRKQYKALGDSPG